MKDETKCLHAGYSPKNAEPRVVPIVQSTTYVYDSTEEVAAVFDDPMKSLIYSRFGNPTVMAVEDKNCTVGGWYRCYVYRFGTGGNLAFHSEYLQCGRQFYQHHRNIRRFGQSVLLYAEKTRHRVYLY
ncbi:MAG: PLP-dependent transferase [Enterocloster clostridioformis]